MALTNLAEIIKWLCVAKIMFVTMELVASCDYSTHWFSTIHPDELSFNGVLFCAPCRNLVALNVAGKCNPWHGQ